MTFLAPLWLAAAALAVAGVFALHLITTQRPPPQLLPTARFVPAGDARASSRAARPTDVLLMLLRCAALLLLGAAFAGPVTHSRGSSLARVLVVDRSRSSSVDIRDSAQVLARQGDALVLFDSSAHTMIDGNADSIRALVPTLARGSLSAGMVAAARAARDLARVADSVEIVIVSPVTADELDAASASIVARWPGRVRLVRVRAAPAASVSVSLVSDDADDALRPAIAAINATRPRGAATHAVRVLRNAPQAADSAAAREGAAVVFWPRVTGANARAEGLAARNATPVATLVATLARAPLSAGGAVIARWGDGARAAAEWPLGRGCIREVGAILPLAGDVALQPAFVSVARSLVGACQGANLGAPAGDSTVKSFSRGGAAATAASLHSEDEKSSLAPWLLAAALLLLVWELFARRRTGEALA